NGKQTPPKSCPSVSPLNAAIGNWQVNTDELADEIHTLSMRETDQWSTPQTLFFGLLGNSQNRFRSNAGLFAIAFR
ncbi:MAG: hypothetical protein VKJ24_19405, partial [Synechococcales bacterium]|nr:hypothetical protein [Synechococcales bacterium]